jgi:exosortase
MTPVRSWRFEAALAALFGALFALSPLSSASRVEASIIGGLLAGIAFGAYRWFSRSTAEDVSTRAAGSTQVDGRLVATIALVLILILPTAWSLFAWYTESVWRNGHGLFLPVLIIAVARVLTRAHEPMADQGSVWGVPLMVLGVALLVIDARLQTLYLGVLAAPFLASGLLLVFLGAQWTWAMAIPIGMLIFFVPLPASMGTWLYLPEATVLVAEGLLRAAGYAVLRQGAELQLLANHAFAVSARCSGFSIVFAGVALATALGAAAGSWKRTLFLLGCIWPAACLANGARVAAFLIVCHWRGLAAAETPVHGLSGIAAFLLVMFTLLLLAGKTARQRLLAP